MLCAPPKASTSCMRQAPAGGAAHIPGNGSVFLSRTVAPFCAGLAFPVAAQYGFSCRCRSRDVLESPLSFTQVQVGKTQTNTAIATEGSSSIKLQGVGRPRLHHQTMKPDKCPPRLHATIRRDTEFQGLCILSGTSVQGCGKAPRVPCHKASTTSLQNDHLQAGHDDDGSTQHCQLQRDTISILQKDQKRLCVKLSHSTATLHSG